MSQAATVSQPIGKRLHFEQHLMSTLDARPSVISTGRLAYKPNFPSAYHQFVPWPALLVELKEEDASIVNAENFASFREGYIKYLNAFVMEHPGCLKNGVFQVSCKYPPLRTSLPKTDHGLFIGQTRRILPVLQQWHCYTRLEIMSVS
jgi:hypothetical protein